MVLSNVIIEFKKPHYVLTKFKGPLSYEKILFTYDEVVNSEDYNSQMGRIWDVSEADLTDLKTDDVWLSARYSEVFPKGIKDSKVAMVSENQENLEKLKLFRTFSKEIEANVEVFLKLKDAINWVIAKED